MRSLYRSFLAHRTACIIGCLIGIFATPLVTVLVVNTSPAASAMYAGASLPDSLAPSPAVIADLHRVGIVLPGEVDYATTSYSSKAGMFFTPNTQWSITARNGWLRADSLLAAGGHLNYMSGSQPANGDATITGTVLCSAHLDSTPFNTPSSGVMTSADVYSCTGTSAATGTGTAAGYAVLYKADSSTVVATFSVGTSGANLNIPSTTITTGEVVSIAAGSVTLTANGSVSGQ